MWVSAKTRVTYRKHLGTLSEQVESEEKRSKLSFPAHWITLRLLVCVFCKHLGGPIAHVSRSLTHSPNFRTYKIILKHWVVVLLTLIAAACAGYGWHLKLKSPLTPRQLTFRTSFCLLPLGRTMLVF